MAVKPENVYGVETGAMPDYSNVTSMGSINNNYSNHHDVRCVQNEESITTVSAMTVE
jgi:hypothetical protein